MEVYAHDPLLASRLLVMAHWKLTPAQIKELGSEDLAIMDFSHRMYERRWSEILTDTFGLLLGSSWPVTAELGEKPEIAELPQEKRARWSLRDRAERISIPLSFVIGGENFVKHMKKLVSEKRLTQRKDPSVLNHPGQKWAAGEEIVDLASVSKEQFLKVASRVK